MDNPRFKNKIVFISGSTKGIGLEIAKSFYSEEACVIINGRNSSGIKKIQSQLPNSLFIPGDVSNPSVAKKIIKKINKLYGGLDVLVCNVGSGRSVKPGKENYDEFKKMIDINFFSAFNLINDAQQLISKRKGSIVCISSICGSESIPGAPITYSVAKAALNHYVKFVSKPLAKRNIRINAITPGNILFEGSVWEKKIKNNKKMVYKMISDNVDLNRFGSTKDVASLVLFLSSEMSSFVTGSIWKVDGGQTKSI